MERKLVCLLWWCKLFYCYDHQCLCYSAVSGTDYNAVPIPDPLVFPTSSTEGMELCAMIGIIDDTALEGEHSFSVHITSTSPQISIEMTYATVEIQDNERKITNYTGTHQFSLYIFTYM